MMNRVPTIAAFLAVTLLLTLLYASTLSGPDGDGLSAQEPVSGSEDPTPTPEETANAEDECIDDPSLAECPPPPPYGITLVNYGTGNKYLKANYTRSTWDGSNSHYYRFELQQSNTRNGTYRAVGSLRKDSYSPVYFGSVTTGKWYRVRAKRCKTYTSPDCGVWSGYSSKLYVSPATD